MLDAIMDMIGGFFGVLGHGLGKLFVSFIALIIYLAFWALQVVTRDLSGGRVFVLLFLWMLMWLCTTAMLFAPSLKIASVLSLVTGLMIVLQTAGYFAPGTVAAAKLISERIDQRNLEQAQRAIEEISTPFDCNRSNADELKFYGIDGLSKRTVPRIWTSRDDNDRIRCFYGAGVDPSTGAPLKAITEAVRQEIRKQEPLTKPVVAVATPLPTPTPVPAPTPTPVPENERPGPKTYGNPVPAEPSRNSTI